MNSDAGEADRADQRPEIETVETRIVYRNRWMTVREDIIRRRDGSPGLYGVVEKPVFAVIIPVEADGAVHLVEQYRYPVGRRFWEFPQGAWEDRPDADRELVARGELREETGLVAGQITYVGHLLHNYGFANHGCHCFIARDLTFAGPAPGYVPDPGEQGLITRRFPFATLLQMVRTGEIQDAVTVSALALAHIKGLLHLP